MNCFKGSAILQTFDHDMEKKTCSLDSPSQLYSFTLPESDQFKMNHHLAVVHSPGTLVDTQLKPLKIKDHTGREEPSPIEKVPEFGCGPHLI